ncbi:peptidoglycan-binding protein LysM [Piscinibacter sp. XHJ-5]|uniref:peptidoglycan-binding protein LysM n=1 Tax=Piscinibacter sp. XHJ-5 TaxID=3037797 RepID=UPI00245352C4|nr:peptidoglycan-binding protein LysM [Piscinibacter sp. XHJ-5]
MSLVSFLKEAGEKLFGGKDAKAAPAAPAAPSPGDVAALNAAAGEAIEKYIAQQNLSAKNLEVVYDGATTTVTVRGEAPDQATREKIVLCCGNVQHVSQVRDEMTVAQAAEAPGTFRTVKSGDTLSKIAKDAYGDANAYMKIFEANKPMLKDPDKIYPGQVLRIPAA